MDKIIKSLAAQVKSETVKKAQAVTQKINLSDYQRPVVMIAFNNNK
ncbi:MAG: hypothetical protein KF799_03210 [Bdellovibrionales bacterium]|nr:hypothetical protein [Bdellovibrionales bacterium]